MSAVGISLVEQQTIATNLFYLAESVKEVLMGNSSISEQVNIEEKTMQTATGNVTCIKLDLSSVIDFEAQILAILPEGMSEALEGAAEARNAFISCIFSIDPDLERFCFEASQLGLESSVGTRRSAVESEIDFKH